MNNEEAEGVTRMVKAGNPDVPLTATTGSDPSINDDTSRCAVCAWPLADSAEKGCVRGNCSLRPTPERWYAPDRAAAEGYGEYARRGRVAAERETAASSIGRTLALQAGRPGSTPGAATSPLPAEAPVWFAKHLRDENVAAHQALDRLGSPLVDGAGFTLGLKARIDWVRERLQAAVSEAEAMGMASKREAEGNRREAWRRELEQIRFHRACALLEQAEHVLDRLLERYGANDPERDDPAPACLLLKIGAFLRQEDPV